MALVKCGECGKEISDKAATCPGCGAPMTSAAAKKAKGTVARKGGKFEAAGFLLIAIGIVTAMAAEGTAVTVGVALAAVGFVVFIMGRFM